MTPPPSLRPLSPRALWFVLLCAATAAAALDCRALQKAAARVERARREAWGEIFSLTANYFCVLDTSIIQHSVQVIMYTAVYISYTYEYMYTLYYGEVKLFARRII